MYKEIVRRDDAGFNPDTEKSALENFIARLFWLRGETENSAPAYALKHLHSPSQLKGLPQALDLLLDALEQQKSILIVGDFDADGATSTAVLSRCLNVMGYGAVEYLVPNRFDYGYGLTPEIVELATSYKPQLIITVDNGISSIEGVAKARMLGIDVLVTDHHLPGKTLPEANAIVNPNQPGCPFPSKNLAGVGVIYYVMLALRAKLRDLNWFAQAGIDEPNLAQFLDLVALGTVADVVPLDYNNRILVAQGIARIQQGRCCAGIVSLLKIANRSLPSLAASDLGFAVGPRLNAAGRLDDMSLGIQCLLTDDPYQALEYAQELDSLNQDRKSIESGMQEEALRALAAIDGLADDVNGVCLYQAQWHQGVIGILASRIKDRLHRPTIIFAQTDSGELKGSGRSIAGIHLRDVLDEVATANPGLLQKFGGHAMAAGLSLAVDQLPLFQREFDRCVGKYLSEAMKSPQILSDANLQGEQLHLTYAQAVRDAGPWGQQFPEPLFDGEFRVVQQKIVGQKHLKLVLTSADRQQDLVDAIAFNVDLNVWPNAQVDGVKMAYRLDVNEFRGHRNVQLMVEYLAPLSH